MTNTDPAEELTELARQAAWGLLKGGDLDAREDGKDMMLARIGILEAAERAGIRVDREAHGMGDIYTREEIEALP